ncbi:MAG TPA: hypothetical protein PLP95_02320 [Microthrixaceae bacterium]|nr:hypothetical protein [Microthrixaceae bacterium]
MKIFSRRRAVAVAALATAGLVGACTPPESGTPDPNVKSVSNAVFEWEISREANNAAFAPGQFNWWNAGTAAATNDATYNNATHGNATVLKKNASGTFVPIGSESAVSFANRTKKGNGAAVTTGNSNFLDQKVRYTAGTGKVNTATGVATISWSGTFTINFYGIYVPFQVANPKLTVDASGKGTLTATLSGIAKDQSDPEAPGVTLPKTNVTLAEVPNFYSSGSIATGASAAQPNYLGKVVTTHPDAAPQTASGTAYHGSWPQNFVNFQNATGLSSYWYSSGGAADALKVQLPFSVNYSIAG